MSRGAREQGGQGDQETRGPGDKETRRQGDKEQSGASPCHPLSPSPCHPLTRAPLLPGVELARLRQGLYRLFGALFLYPDRDRLATLRAVAGELQQADDFWGSYTFSEPLRRLLKVLSELGEGAKEEIEEEYVRLFLVKPMAPPYQSFYLDPDGQARGWIAVQLEREYTHAGLALSPSQKKLPDHVAVELEFMAFLCGQQAQALEEGTLEGGDQAQECQRAFLGQHLGRWFPRFALQVNDAASEALYGVAAEAAHAFLHYDLGLLLRDNDEGSQSVDKRW